MNQILLMEEEKINDFELDKLIKDYSPVIKVLAYRLSFRLPAHLEVSDLINAGIIGLVDAAKKYDPTKETKFKTYAEYRIRGSMLDEIRAMEWIPRSVKEKINIIQKTYYDLEKELKRPPSEEEVAETLKMEIKEFHELLYEAKGTIMINVEDLGIEQENKNMMSLISDGDERDPLSLIISSDVKKVLVRAIEDLPEKEKLIISMYYFNELTMKEVGNVLSITESRVCQLHTQAVLRLKSKLKSIKNTV